MGWDIIGFIIAEMKDLSIPFKKHRTYIYLFVT